MLDRRVALLTQTGYPSGLAEARGIARELVAAGVSTTVICARKTGDTTSADPDVIEAGPIGGRLDRIGFAARAAAAIRRIKPDLVHVYSFRGFGALPVLARGPKFLIDVRTGNVSGRPWTRLADRVTRLESTLYDGRAVISRDVGTYVCGPGWSSATVIPLGYPRQAAEKAREQIHARTPDLITIGHVGSLHPTRQLERLLSVAHRLARQGVRARWLVVGDGPARAVLEARSSMLGLDDIVEFRGAVPSDDIWSSYAEMDVAFAYVPAVAHFEYQPPLKTIEAMACGLPVVTTDTAGNREFVTSAKNGLLVPDDEAALANALAAIVADPARRRQLGMAATAAAERFAWDAIVRDIVIPMYAGLLA